MSSPSPVPSAPSGPLQPAGAAPGAFKGVDLAILLPTLNEEEGLRQTYPELPLQSLREAGWKVRVLVIDGGSTDTTLSVAAGFGLTVLHQTSSGKGAALQEALRWLHGEGVGYAIVLDADCTYPGSAIGPMAALLEAGSDVVIGVRYPAAPQAGSLSDAVHRGGNAFLNFSASVLTHRPILDLCSGLWGVRVPAAADLQLESQRFEVEAELYVKAFRRGLAVSQIPITYRQRVGEAKLRATRDGVQIFLTLFRWAASPGFPPRPPPRVGPRYLRSLLAVLFVHGAANLAIASNPSQSAEASDLARRLKRAGIRAEVRTVETVRLDRDPLARFTGPASPETPELEVLLMSGTAPGGAEAIAVVEVPKRNRVVVIGPASSSSLVSERNWLHAYRLDEHDRGSDILAPLQAAHASITARRPRQESALLRANAFRSEIRLYQRSPTAPRATVGKPTVAAPPAASASRDSDP
jgi:hypothetical protein